MRSKTLLVTAALAALAAPAFSQEKAQARFTYDENYLYAAFEVDNPQLLGSRREPMAKGIEEDDGVGVSIRVGEGPVRTMLVSVAGGFSFLENGTPKPLFSIKYGVNLQGTLNRTDDRDKGYTVELAIPWDALGVDPKTVSTQKLTYQLTVRKRGVPKPALFPAELGPLTLVKADRTPLIDGELREGEWPAVAARFDVPVGAPLGALVPITPVPLDPSELTAVPLDPAGLRERRLFARFLLSYQADFNKLAFPVQGLLAPNGTFLPIDQPAMGFGPWYSADRVGWARTELTQMQRAGIEVALTQVGLPESAVAPLEDKGLTVLVAALREMQAERQPILPLALWLETKGLKPDLATPEGQSALYAAVVRWFAQVPAELRATVRVGGVSVYPVFLSDSTGLVNANTPGWTEALRQRFAAEFGALTGGVSLAFVGSGFAGALPYESISPGSQEPLVPRKNGETYFMAWEKARKAGAPWIVLDSWNDFTRATELAPSRQYGDQYVELTRRLSLLPEDTKAARLQFGTLDIPHRMAAGTLMNIPITLTNVSGRALTMDDSISVGYRWVQEGKTVAEGPIRIPLREALLPSFSTKISLGVATLLADGKPLPQGSYELRLEVLTPGERVGIGLPVRVEEKPTDAVQFTRSTMTPLGRTGESFPATVTLRWLGKETLPPGEAQLLYQLLSNDGKEVLSSGSAPIDLALKPGVYVSAPILVSLTGPGGVPLEPAFPERRLESPDLKKAGYRLRWALTRAGSTSPIVGSYEEFVAVYPGEDDARVLLTGEANYPDMLPSGKPVPVKVTLVNRGLKRWEKGKVALTGRWFQADGIRAQQTQTILNAFLERDIAPGESVDLALDVATPDRPGKYVLALFALRPPEVYFPVHPITRTGDMLLLPITVTEGHQYPLDLTGLFNADVVATEQARKDGDLDGTGVTLPAEWFPSDAFGLNKGTLLYPSGYYADIASLTARAIGFRYGATAPGQKNVIACAGQVLVVPKGRYTGLHLAGVSTGGQERNLTLVFTYKDKSTQTITRVVQDIAAPPAEDEAIAFTLPRWRTAEKDTAAKLTVRHMVFPIPIDKELVSITLPNDPKVKVFAVTLQK